MSVITEHLDSNPYTRTKNIKGKVRVKTHEEASWLDNFFNGTPNYSKVENITRGKIHDVVKIEGLGDCEDITIIDDKEKEQRLSSFFFVNID